MSVNILYLGVRRPLALLCPNAESCPYLANYEICQVEPLHDLKNVISRLFEELPSCAEDLLLKSVIKEKLDAMNGMRLNMCEQHRVNDMV